MRMYSPCMCIHTAAVILIVSVMLANEWERDVDSFALTSIDQHIMRCNDS